MLNRRELPPLLQGESVQTSGLDIQPDPDISGMIVSKRRQVNKSSEVLDTTDPLPLDDFGPIGSLTLAVPLALLAVAIVWGIVKGIIGLVHWIRIGIEILPLGYLW